MPELLHALPLLIALAVIILFASIAAQSIVSRIFKNTFLEEHQRVVEPLLGVVGTLYSVLLGFMVGGAMDRYEDCVITADLEANSVVNVFRLAQGLEAVDRLRIRSLCRNYVLNVTAKEWGEMKHHKPINAAQEPYNELWDASLALQPGDDQRITNIQQSLLESMTALGENRRLRIVGSQHGLSLAQWLVIGVGSGITVLFCLFFPVSRGGFQSFLTGLVAVSLGLNIWLLNAYSTPFAGALQIQPYMFGLNAATALSMPDKACRYLKQSDQVKDQPKAGN